jgi:putative copper export protein
MLLPFFQWIESLQFSTAVDDGGYFTAGVNVMHLLALTVFVGALLVVDLRLLGRGMKKQPLAQVARDAQPWLIGGFLAMLSTGIPQVLATPIKEYYSPHFWLKMEVILVALIFTFTVRRRIALADEARVAAVWRRLVGIVSIAMWTTVATAGRLIGLMS